jgi:wyosine [tRNA(Phe)-imidazoG37] synthetase (radical SAM superfamily)
MATFLFDEIIFGPVKSRRFGVSLGINLLPNDSKFCNFNCIYCECGWTKEKLPKINFHKPEFVKESLENKLKTMRANNESLDVITFAGNGEPTLHPNFDKIIDDTIEVRNEFFPSAEIAVLSNSTMLNKYRVVESLKKIDQNILKLDSAIPETIKLLNNPQGFYNLDYIIDNFSKFDGDFILQTMFVKGKYNNIEVDNTSDVEVNTWLDLVKKINPKKVMIYTIARDTPAPELEKISLEKLNEIANKLISLNMNVQISS